jgi:hypothetical protein
MAGQALPVPLPVRWRWATFEKVEPPSCRRSYRIEIIERDGYWSVVALRGRIGSKPRPLMELFPTAHEAVIHATKRARDRLLHRYTITGSGK